MAHDMRVGLFKRESRTTCAMIRAGMAATARKTWTVAKPIDKLRNKLDICIAVHNNYEFF
ncbi:MAG: hypothetical protein PHS32_01425 [Rhodoferax sp.]|uniref:hypothetical protein n=1 Tax=Rhodoferax sp. TaxID=50421 RepID=UPI00262227B7|nr:hypothetical protein [Rhodoferax sp.]MDD5332378.1 hypothetical protein [Rhodoferax sp.]